MDNVSFVEILGIEHAVIDRGNGEMTSMTKVEYDRRQAEQVEHLTEIPTEGDDQ